MRSFFLLLFLIPLMCFAQFSDDFSDGDFTNNTEWTGNTERFIINSNNELQLNDSDTARSSFLSTISESINNASWEFIVKMRFKPSSQNYCDIYLVSDSEDLNNVTNGYFVKIGNSTRDICLYRKDPSSSVKIIDGTDDRINLNSVNIRVKVTRDTDGYWTLFTDTLGGTDYYLEGSSIESTYTSSSYFGVSCVYSKTRAQHFHFDDFIVTGTAYSDDEPPLLLSHEIIGNNKILLVFNEPLDPLTALSTNNYLLNNGGGNPLSATFYESVDSKVLLEFGNEFISPASYTLRYENITDLSGNLIVNSTLDFDFIIVQPGSVVINEIMANEKPVVAGLPEAEYIELYNTTGNSLDLTGWGYKVGNNQIRIFPASQIESNGFLILCKDTFVSQFESYGNTVGFSSFPALNNNGTAISIFDNNNNIIDQVTYSNSWYRDNNKRNGGWSLERIDPLNSCSPESNWLASTDENGGTPGSINSVYADNTDTIPPEVLNISVISANEINIVFSEPTDTNTTLDINNYLLSNDFGTPVYVYANTENPNSFIIRFSSSFIEGIDYSLDIRNIRDLCNNTMESQTFNFSVYNAGEYDVIICEIMAKPDPVIALPDAEYIELYNRTSVNIDISSWSITVGTTKRKLPYSIIPPGKYIILCNQSMTDLFEIDNITGVSGFPSLPNTSGTITLRDKNDNVIHTVNYNDSWFNDQFKKKGGYSLEMIDPNNPCEGSQNWTATKDLTGGTPGRVNSVNDLNPDISSPYPYAAEAIAPDTLIVYFNEPLKQHYANNVNNFEVEGFGTPEWITAAEPDFSIIKMKFSSSFERGIIYYLEIMDSIVDCSNNPVAENTSIRFALGDSVVKNDIVINEILFNPYSGGNDFVEIYNRSDKVLDLKLLWLSNRDAGGELDNTTQISTISRLLMPEEYCAITTDISDLENNYHILYPENLYQPRSLPSMPNDYGSIILTDRSLNIIDDVTYDKSQHYKLLSSQKGVSLERINFNRPSGDLSNWHSASQVAGFATPGYENSQFSSEITSLSGITLTPKTFSPDNDGYEDRLTISYILDEPGYTATISVYNSNGSFIKYIINNEMLGTEGNLFWDGFDQDNNLCPMGIYIIYVELFNLNGKKILEKHAVVINNKN